MSYSHPYGGGINIGNVVDNNTKCDTFSSTGMNSLFVGDLGSTCTEEDIRELFSTYGNIMKIRMMIARRKSMVSLGYCFVEFEREEDALRAKENLNGHLLCGRHLRVKSAQHGVGGHPDSVDKDTLSLHVRFSCLPIYPLPSDNYASSSSSLQSSNDDSNPITSTPSISTLSSSSVTFPSSPPLPPYSQYPQPNPSKVVAGVMAQTVQEADQINDTVIPQQQGATSMLAYFVKH